MDWNKLTVNSVVVAPILGEGFVTDFLIGKYVKIRLMINNKELTFNCQEIIDHGISVVFYSPIYSRRK